jgi:hypothetical protein
MSHSTDWAAALERERREKDRLFADHPRSPIPGDQRIDFDGLSYFPPAPDFRVEARLIDHESPQTVTVATTTEGHQEYLGVGEFRVTVANESVHLQAYRRPDDDGEGLWVPFRDATNTETTYGAGRYLDLDATDHRTADGEWVLDFNRAYNPYCAYNDAYECPLVPMENWLAVPIEAGERRYDPAGDAGRGDGRSPGHHTDHHDHDHDRDRDHDHDRDRDHDHDRE